MNELGLLQPESSRLSIEAAMKITISQHSFLSQNFTALSKDLLVIAAFGLSARLIPGGVAQAVVGFDRKYTRAMILSKFEQGATAYLSHRGFLRPLHQPAARLHQHMVDADRRAGKTADRRRIHFAVMGDDTVTARTGAARGAAQRGRSAGSSDSIRIGARVHKSPPEIVMRMRSSR